MKIYYKKGYKYQLATGFSIKTTIRAGVHIETKYLTLNKNGILVIKPGYAWDGPSGPAIDTPSFMRASLVHDALYQLMRMGCLLYIWRSNADQLLYDLCIEDGMWTWRAYLAYRAVHRFAAGAADASNKKEIIEAGS